MDTFTLAERDGWLDGCAVGIDDQQPAVKRLSYPTGGRLAYLAQLAPNGAAVR